MTCDAHFRTRISYSSQKSCVKIWFGLVEPFKSYHLNFPWGQKPPIRGVACDLQCPFLDLAELFQSKVICVNLVRIGWAFQELSCPQHFSMGQNPPIKGGLHLTCDAHFLTRMSYSSQKLCVEIWFGLVEIGDMTCDAHFELGRGCLDKSHVWEFSSDWLRLSRVIVWTNQMTRGRRQGRGRGWGQKFLK